MSFIDAHRDRFGVEPICRTLGIAPSTYYARKTRSPSRRAVDDAVLLDRIRAVHEQMEADIFLRGQELHRVNEQLRLANVALAAEVAERQAAYRARRW